MNIVTLLKTELRKHKRGFIWLMVLGIPLGTTLAMFLDMYMRYDNYLLNIAKEKGLTSWEILLRENHLLLGWSIFLPLFVAIIATMVHYIEFEENNWKNILTLPIKRCEIYLSKYIVIVLFSFLMITLNTFGLIIVGKIIGFPEGIDFTLYGGYVLHQFIAILGVAALHNFLSSHLSNVIIPVAAAFAGIIITPAIMSKFPLLAKSIPYSYIHYIDVLNLSQSTVALYGGLISMILISIIGMWSFSKKDIL